MKFIFRYDPTKPLDSVSCTKADLFDSALAAYRWGRHNLR